VQELPSIHVLEGKKGWEDKEEELSSHEGNNKILEVEIGSTA
jgi:hypothetical protein